MEHRPSPPVRLAARASAALTVAAVVGGMLVAGPQNALAATTPGVAATSTDAVPDSTAPDGAASTGSPVLPQIYPRPQSQQSYGRWVTVPSRVTLVAAPQADPAALRVVREVLGSAGVRQIDDGTGRPWTGRAGADAAPAGELTVYVGGLAEGAGGATDRALRGLAGGGGTAAPLSPVGMPSGGYVLAAGRLPVGNGPLAAPGAVVLAGVDAAGTFNAAQSLRQLLVPTHDGFALPGVRVADWPSTPVRGIEEGFFGTPWSTAQTVAELDFLGRGKQNFFLYSPGDDPYRGVRWRDAYPAAEQARLSALTAAATAQHVTFGYGLALGGSVCFTSAQDRTALLNKLDQLWALGVRSFQLQFQDSSFTHWHCTGDLNAYGRGPAAMARAQSALVAQVLQHTASRYPGMAPLSILPTEFYQDGATPYRTALAGDLDPSVQVAWSGVGIQPGSITAAQAAAAGRAFGHPLIVQDNYAINDSAPDRLFLGPYLGREAGVATRAAALVVSAMQQPAASRIPLFTAADFAWNPAGYDAGASWQAASRSLAAGQPGVAAALAALAGNSASPAGTVVGNAGTGTASGAAPAAGAAAGAAADAGAGASAGGQESAYLLPLIAAFWSTQGQGGDAHAAAAAALRAAFTTMATSPEILASAGSPLAAEDAPWLAQLSAYGTAGQAAVDMLTAQRAGLSDAAWTRQVALRQQVQQLGQSPVTLGTGVLDAFLKRALTASTSWAGLADGQVLPTGSLGTAQDHAPALMVDGDPGTYFWSDAPPQVDDTFGIDLGSARPIGAVTVRMGAGDGSSAAGDILHNAVLEYSGGDGGWHRVGSYQDQRTVTATLPAGTVARYVRLRATATQTSAVAVSEFEVSAPSGGTATVTGGPVGLPGSPVSNVADGDLDTAYRAVASPQAGDALTMDLGESRSLDRVLVLTDPNVAALGSVEVRQTGGAPRSASDKGGGGRQAGNWVRVGALGRGYTELPVDPKLPVDGIRLVWTAGGPPPVVNQIVPWYADTPTASLQLPQQSLDLEIGGAPGTLTGSLQALGLTGATGVVSAQPPKEAKGLTVSTPGTVTLSRGASVSTPLVFTAAAGAQPGSYTVPVGFTASGRTVTQSVQVHLYPRTSGPDLAPTATATSSGDETPAFPASAVADGDPATRWSSPAKDDAWVQLQLPAQRTLGSAVLHWQDAYAAQYRIETSVDGVAWTTAATVLNGAGGVETVRFNAPNVRYLRVQGVQRATRFGYSLYGIELYAVAGSGGPGGPVLPPVTAGPTAAPTPDPSGTPGAGAVAPSTVPNALPSIGALIPGVTG